MTEKFKQIADVFSSAGIPISEKQAEQFFALYEFMVEYNEKVNLTSITEFENVVMKHFVDSVLPFAGLEFKDSASFIDVGTGAGYPGIPLMIYRPDLRGTLCDSLEKRCVYLRLVCEKLGIKAEIIHERSEELGRKRRESFDFATARAVAAMPVLSEYCIPFVRVGGSFAALKSVNEDISTAENAVKVLGGKIESVSDYKLPNGDDRRLVIIKKVSATPAKYPRGAGKIRKEPL